jgi:Domain of unknown function (DUF4259)
MAQMGTFGTDAFSSDGARDLLQQLAERPPQRRVAALEHMFAFVSDNPELLGRKFFADEIVAAAAVVAATLPGGESLDHRLRDLANDDLVSDVRLSLPTPALAASALEALLTVAGPDGPWQQGWVTDADADEARNTTNTLIRVLGQS